MNFLKADIEEWATERKCFQYSDGTQDLWADPMEVLDRMNAFAEGDANKIRDAAFPDPEPVIAAVTNPETGEIGQAPKLYPDGSSVLVAPESSEEDKERFYAMIRYGFELQPFDKRTRMGHTRAMLFTLWNEFQAWLEKKSPEPDSSPTYSAPTVEASLPV